MVDFRDRANGLLKRCTNIMGEQVILYPKNGGNYKIKGIFDNDYQLIDPDTQQVISSNQSVLGVNLFDLNIDIYPGDKIKIRNLFYKVNEIREDGQGGASLILHKTNHGQKIFKKKDSTNP